MVRDARLRRAPHHEVAQVERDQSYRIPNSFSAAPHRAASLRMKAVISSGVLVWM
jgi:hypothetical protein